MTQYETCSRCGMIWLPAAKPVELLPGTWTTGRVTTHICPEPFPPETARSLLSFYLASGMPTSQRIKARIKLGLESG